MMKKYSSYLKGLLVLSLMLGAFFLGSAYAGLRPVSDDSFFVAKHANIFSELQDVIRSEYLGEINWDNVFYGMMTGMVYGLDDPYSEYFSPDDAALFWEPP